MFLQTVILQHDLLFVAMKDCSVSTYSTYLGELPTRICSAQRNYKFLDSLFLPFGVEKNGIQKKNKTDCKVRQMGAFKSSHADWKNESRH